MNWLRSRSSQVLPPSSERNSAERVRLRSARRRRSDSTARSRPRGGPTGAAGKPFAVFASSCRPGRAAVARCEQAAARAARRAVAAGAEGPALAAEVPQPGEETLGIASGPCVTTEQPVDRFGALENQRPASCRRRSSCRDRARRESLHSLPGTQAYTVLPFARVDDDR